VSGWQKNMALHICTVISRKKMDMLIPSSCHGSITCTGRTIVDVFTAAWKGKNKRRIKESDKRGCAMAKIDV
jgi:hypothetical protein